MPPRAEAQRLESRVPESFLQLLHRHAMLERLPAVDEEDRNIAALFFTQLRRRIDVDLLHLEERITGGLANRCFHLVAQAAMLPGVEEQPSAHGCSLAGDGTRFGSPVVGSPMRPFGMASTPKK